MIDLKLLTSAIELVDYQLERANIHIDGVDNPHIAVLLAAAEKYQSAVVSKDEIHAAMISYMQTKTATLHSDLLSNNVFEVAMRAALVAAKIKNAEQIRVILDTDVDIVKLARYVRGKMEGELNNYIGRIKTLRKHD